VPLTTLLLSSQVTLPKFKLESTHELTAPLKKIGIPNAFFDCANFRGITGQPLSIDGVTQKAFIEVQ
jgi:serine protease inhibitor